MKTQRLLVLGLLPPLVALSAVTAVGQIQPNFVVILSDDQGWNGLSTPMDPDVVGALSGSDFYETPNLASLASQGMRFRQAYAAAPNCSPTRASIQFGLNPATMNMTDIVGRDDLYRNAAPAGTDLMEPLTVPRAPVAGVEPLAQRIKQADAGYVTAHLGKWHLTTPAVRPAVAGGPVAYRAGDPSDYGFDLHDGARGNNPINSAGDPKEIFSLSSRAIGFMADRVGDSAPFYLQVSHYAVHDGPVTLPDTQDKYQDKLASDPGLVHPGGDQTNRVRYAGMTEDLDTGVGQILDYLASTPDPRNPGMMLEDTTYVIYTSDNGALTRNTSNLPLYDEKATSWEGGVRVPMIVRGPGVSAGAVSGVPVVSTDLYATISSLAGASDPLPSHSDSADFSPVLHNGGRLPGGQQSLVRGSGENGEVFIHFPHYVRDTTPMSSMIEGDGSYKFVRLYGVGGQHTDYLFDLNRPVTAPGDTWETIDPNDPRNLANSPAHAARLASMRGRFDAWVQTADASLPYEIAAPVEIQWNAADNSRDTGFEGPAWRSVTDVDSRPREQMLFDLSGGGTVELIDLGAGGAGLGGKAYRLSGGGGFLRSFFHVSEDSPGAGSLTITPDVDDSASFEFWFRSADLSTGQVLLESGGGARGLSITLGGDANNPEVRLRLADNNAGKALVTTASLAGVDVLEELVHLVAVVEETDAGGQVASLYLNGVLASQSADVIGGGNVNWDGPGNAGIGRVATVLGGVNGPGLGPLGTAGFEGDLAHFAFLNTALTAAQVADRYAAVPEPTSLSAAAVALALLAGRRR